MKILFFEPYTLTTPNFERCLELMETHLEKGNEIHFLGCHASMPACDRNPPHLRTKCTACTARGRSGLDLLQKKITSKDYLNLKEGDYSVIEEYRILEPENVEALKKIKYQNLDLGYAVASSIISIYRNPKPDLKPILPLVQNFIVSTLQVYLSMLNHLKEGSYDAVYFFNGRYAPLRAARRACEYLKIDYFLHEQGANIYRYAIYNNVTPHNLEDRENIINQLWESADVEDREKFGSAYYEKREQGNVIPRYNHTKLQKAGLLPDNWDSNKKNIAIFNSSEDEFAAIGDEWKHPIYQTQLEGLERLIASIQTDKFKDHHFYLRMHPNLKQVSNETVEAMNQLAAPNFTVIKPLSKVSTYTLLKAVDVTVTFGSTVGIEAAYWEKPSILLGTCFYKKFGSTYNPHSHEAFLEMLLKDLSPLSKEGALKYGFYRETYGIPYEYYQPETLLSGKFKNQEIKIPPYIYLPFRLSHALSFYKLKKRWRALKASASNK